MQDKQSNEFDLQVRSMLEDAGVRPPRRVWRGISARLDDAAAAAAGSWSWMKWAGMGLAAACLAAAVFFSGTDHSIPTIIHNQEQAMLAQAGEPAGAPAGAGVPAAVPAAKPVGKAASRPSGRVVPVPSPQTAETAPAPEAAQPAAGPGAGRTERKAPAGNEARKNAFVQDPFADPEQPVGRKAVRPGASLYAQGSIRSNDSDFRTAPVSMMAPGTSDGFSELGASSYRIPFTVGLGVRFYLTPRFSIGTGLDYSLLTRTFTGSYGEVSGTVNHTLQYLGIPLGLYYDVLSYDKVRLYVHGGGEAELNLSNKYRLFASPDITRAYPVNGLQYSVFGGLGVEFRLGRNLGLYLDPGISYYFPGEQPRSIRTDQPLQLRFDAGLRFRLGSQKP